MRLFEAVLAANRRALAGDSTAGVRVADYADEIPIIALTCIDPRLNRLLPGALGLPEEFFIWLRNAGNIISSPQGSTMRSLALACAIKGGREIAVIGHTDCQVRKTTPAVLLEKFKALGVDRQKMPDNIGEYFGLFAGERQNVVRAVEFIRSSPLISSKTFVQGLLIDIQTGSLEWVVNGYELPAQAPDSANGLQFPGLDWKIGSGTANSAFELGEMKTQDIAIGETASKPPEPIAAATAAPQPSAPPVLPTPQRQRAIPLPPPIRMKPGGRA
jgi:carbonic anhydrase